MAPVPPTTASTPFFYPTRITCRRPALYTRTPPPRDMCDCYNELADLINADSSDRIGRLILRCRAVRQELFDYRASFIQQMTDSTMQYDPMNTW